MSAFIPIDEAVKMNAAYRGNRNAILKPEYQDNNILAISETFEKEQVQALLDKKGCTALRIYFGMDDQMKVHCVLVAADAHNADILPPSEKSKKSFSDDDFILETGQRCPEDCPPDSPLNGG